VTKIYSQLHDIDFDVKSQLYQIAINHSHSSAFSQFVVSMFINFHVGRVEFIFFDKGV
jgi:hypothetical protein